MGAVWPLARNGRVGTRTTALSDTAAALA